MKKDAHKNNDDPFNNDNDARHNLLVICTAIEEQIKKQTYYEQELVKSCDEYQAAIIQHKDISSQLMQIEVDHKDGAISDTEFLEFKNNMVVIEEKIKSLDREKSYRPKQINDVKSNLFKLRFRKDVLENKEVNEFVNDRKQNVINKLIPLMAELIGLSSLEAKGQQVDITGILTFNANQHGTMKLSEINESGIKKVKNEFLKDIYNANH